LHYPKPRTENLHNNHIIVSKRLRRTTQQDTVGDSRLRPRCRPGELDKTYAFSLIMSRSLHYSKSFRHPQN